MSHNLEVKIPPKIRGPEKKSQMPNPSRQKSEAPRKNLKCQIHPAKNPRPREKISNAKIHPAKNPRPREKISNAKSIPPKIRGPEKKSQMPKSLFS
jgi:hypothetical protein